MFRAALVKKCYIIQGTPKCMSAVVEVVVFPSMVPAVAMATLNPKPHSTQAVGTNGSSNCDSTPE